MASSTVAHEITPHSWLPWMTRCMRKNPWVFIFGLFGGASLGLAFLSIESEIADRQPYSRPTLNVMNPDDIHPGGFILFAQSITGARRCENETSRVLFRFIGSDVVDKLVLSDSNLAPSFDFEAGKKVIIRVPVPPGTPVGTWYYVRRTEYWCSILARRSAPGIQETIPTRIEVRPNPVL